LIPVNEKLLRHLQGVEELPPPERQVGLVFVTMVGTPFSPIISRPNTASHEQMKELKVYQQYCVEQDKSMEVREKLYQRPIFMEFLEETYKVFDCGCSLDNILIQPMQRITRYPLLLKVSLGS